MEIFSAKEASHLIFIRISAISQVIYLNCSFNNRSFNVCSFFSIIKSIAVNLFNINFIFSLYMGKSYFFQVPFKYLAFDQFPYLPLNKKMKLSIKDFFSKYDQMNSFLRIWSYLLKKSLLENFIFRAVFLTSYSWNNRY